MGPIEDLKNANKKRSEDTLNNNRHDDLVNSNYRLQETVLKSFKSLVDYLDNRTSKTAVVNQLRSIGTPDALKVAESVDNLHETIKAHQGDEVTQRTLADISKTMSQVLDQAKQIPKKQITPEKQKFVDYTKQMATLQKAVESVEMALKNQSIVVEAPVINVPETNVSVEAPDLSPLGKDLKAIEKAVKKIVLPKPEKIPSNSKIEKELQKHTKTLEKILDKPTGGLKGQRATPYSDSNDNPAFVTLTNNGKIPVDPGLAINGQFDYLSATNTATNEDTLVYKQGGSGGTTVQTLVITYASGAEKVSDSIAALAFS